MAFRFQCRFQSTVATAASFHQISASNSNVTNLRNMDDLTQIMGQYYTTAKIHGIPYQPKQSLKPRRMYESHAQAIIPLVSISSIRHRYISHSGAVRFGKLLEDMDQFAAWVAYLHNDGDEEAMATGQVIPRTMVTANVDRIDVQQLVLPSNQNLILDGHVSWTGRTTLLSSIRVLQENSTQLLKANFLMAARNPYDSSKSVPVHPLFCPTPGEADLFSQGEVLSQARKTPSSPQSVPSFKTEHFFKPSYRPLCHDEALPIELSTVQICFPEQISIYGKVFGGTVMRLGFEVAAATSKEFCKCSTEIVTVQNVSFRKIVNLGDTLKFKAKVIYSKDTYVQVKVDVEVVDFNGAYPSHTMHFTFQTQNASKLPKVVTFNEEGEMDNFLGKELLHKAINFSN